MDIKKGLKFGFLIIVGLFLIIVVTNNLSLYKIQENNTYKNKIFEIITIQENMNSLILDVILTDNLKDLEQLSKNFAAQETHFENIRSNFFENDEDDLLDALLTDLHKYPQINEQLNILFENEIEIENAFVKILDLQKQKININNELQMLYPQESDLRERLKSNIWNKNDILSLKKFSDLRYYSKEALYQYRSEQIIDKWIDIAKSLEIYTDDELYQEYIPLTYKIKEKILQSETIKVSEKRLIDDIKKVLILNNEVNGKIEKMSENILNNFINNVNNLMIILSIIVIVWIVFIALKVNKNVGLSIDEIQERVDVGLKTIKELNNEIEDTQKEVVFTMGAIGESRSKETGNHVKRVAEYSKLLALHYGLDPKEAEMLKQASPMHDIGKVAIPDAILNKPGRFDDKEREIMNTHSKIGYEMLRHSNRPLLKCAAIVAHEHHEKWDGTGYPRGLKEEEIHIYGRITALADVFDALGSDRCYKKAWEDEKIFQLFKEEKGKHFDPKLIDIFFENLDQFLAIREKFRDM